MDMGWSTNPTESFRLFQGRVLDEYDRMVDEFGLSVIDAVRQHHRPAADRPRAGLRSSLEQATMPKRAAAASE